MIPLLMLVACGREEVPGEVAVRDAEGTVYHGLIQLGEKLDDPYTVQNMQAALNATYPTKAGRVDVVATDLYVRFLPQTDEQLRTLEGLGLALMDHPMDYRIVREGDYYHDPGLGEDQITWQYAVVPHSFEFPPDIRCEVLDECYISEHDPQSKAGEIDWALVEREAFRLTGNAGLLAPETKAGGAAPHGRITIEDPQFSGGKPFGVAGVKVMCNIFVKMATCYTDRDGYYAMERSFSGNPRYRLVFQNTQGFNIGLNLILLQASVSTLGKGGPEGIDCHVTRDSDGALFRRCAVNNAAYEYYLRCTQEDLDIVPPPDNLRLWILNGLTASSASMLHHGAALDNALLTSYLGAWLSLIKLFLPDITLGTKEQDYAGIYKMTMHELAHASHYAQVGNSFWGPYIEYVVRSYLDEGQNAYGSGDGDGAGYCELGECWGYFMQESLYKDRYGGLMASFGNSFWFKPDILTSLYERGLSRGDIFRAMKPQVTSMEQLKTELVSQYKDKENVINQIFKRYGK